jgi:hypothetical protein
MMREINLPREMIYTIVDTCLKSGIGDVIYPLTLTCKGMNEMVLEYVHNIFKSNVKLIEVPPKNITNLHTLDKYSVTKKYQSVYGILHGIKIVDKEELDTPCFIYDKISYKFGKRDGICLDIERDINGCFTRNFVNWKSGSIHGISICDSGSYLGCKLWVTHRCFQMFCNNRQSNLQINISLNHNSEVMLTTYQPYNNMVGKSAIHIKCISLNLLISSAEKNIKNPIPTQLSEELEQPENRCDCSICKGSKLPRETCTGYIFPKKYPDIFPPIDDLEAWYKFYYRIVDMCRIVLPTDISNAENIDKKDGIIW